MSWAASYLDIPFVDRGSSREGCDCHGLVQSIFRDRLGIHLPDYPEIPAGANLAKIKAILSAAQGPQWTEIPRGEEQAFDVVLMRSIISVDDRRHSRPIHIGCVTSPGTMIHIQEKTGVSIVNYRRDPMIRNRVTGFYRFAQ
jgi:cell wall-associated NlpC family hydrolase